jgi:molecular chaperone DnaK
MATFVGIDLGTTNTSIATFDGKNVEVRKSLGGAFGQSETTPSAIFIDDNQATWLGADAYKQIAYRPEDVARAWKRLLGTGAPVEFKAANLKNSAEWCSTELLKRVFGYLPSQVRQDPLTSVVITVPAAFGQQKNEATLQAAQAAGIANVKLMPEPVAACLAVMHKDRSDKTFLVYDLGGGTFDASVARFGKGSGSIIAQGGIESSGGRDWDFEIVNKVVIPWICDNYDLGPDDLNSANIKNMLAMEAEKAKIELSARYEQEGHEEVQVQIMLPDGDIKVGGKRLTDGQGREVGLNVPFKKSKMDQIAKSYIQDTVTSCKQVLSDNNVTAEEIDYVVFIGGPTLYKPLREKVCADLGIEIYPNYVDPMTAVAKGAAIYAESLDWSRGGRRPSKQNRTATSQADGTFPLAIEYQKRVTDKRAKVVLTLDVAKHEVVSVEIKNAVFSTGNMNITYSKEITLTLAEDGENVFDVVVTAPGVSEPMIKQIIITRGIEFDGATAPKSYFIELWDSADNKAHAEYVVRVGEQLPKTGTFKARAPKELKANNNASFSLKVYEGEIADRVGDNTYVGMLSLTSDQIGNHDVIAKEDELICDFTVDDGLNLTMNVSVISIGDTFELKLSADAIKNPRDDWQELADSGKDLRKQIEKYVQSKPNEDLEALLSVIQDAVNTIETSVVDEEVQTAGEKIRQARRKFWDVRKQHIPEFLTREIEGVVRNFKEDFDGRIFSSATPAEKKKFDQETEKAKQAAEISDAESVRKHLVAMSRVIGAVVWRSDWWIELKLDEVLKNGSQTEKEIAQQGKELLEDGDEDTAGNLLNSVFASRRSRYVNGAADDTIVVRDHQSK